MIVPLFVIITVLLIMLDFFMHDTIISRCTAFKTAMTSELSAGTSKLGIENEAYNDKGTENNYVELERTASEYLKEKTIALSDAGVSINEDKNGILVSCTGKNNAAVPRIAKLPDFERKSVVKRNAPDNFVRTVSAIRNAIR